MSLYEDLGVGKDASPDEIKRAYREGSKRTHPDAGGDPEQFKQLAVAYKILSDEEKRKRYDQGEPVDSLRGQAMTEDQEARAAIAQCLGGVIDQVDVNQQNVVELLRKGLRNAISGMDAEKVKARKAEEKWSAFLKRLKNAKEDCPMTQVANNNLLGIQKGLEALDRQKRIGELALKYLDDYGYDFEAPKEMTVQEYLARAAQQQYQGIKVQWGQNQP